MGQENVKSALSIKITSSQTESQELFDYHQTSSEFQQKTIKSPSFVVTDGETVKITHHENQHTHQSLVPTSPIYKIAIDDFQQIKIQHLGSQLNKTLWRVIKYGETYPIKVGDTLKIGKIQIKLKKIVGQRNQRATQEYSDKEDDKSPLKDDGKSVKSNVSEISRCRICFGQANNKNDPLVCLCKCSGSIQFTHFQCLKDWILNSITRRQDENYKFYAYNDIKCQLCKEEIPIIFQHQGKQYSFFGKNFQAPYAQFESEEMDENGRKKHHKYIIKLQEHKEITIGRNNTCQVLIKDISVSRSHCSLQYKHGSLFVRDKKSKFGTLIKVQKSLQFNLQHGLKLQFQTNVIEIYRKNRLKGCCCSDSDNFRLVYEVDQKQKDEKKDKKSKEIRNLSMQFQNNSYQQDEEIQFDINPNNVPIQTRNELLQTTQTFKTHRRQTMHRNTQALNGAIRY